MLHLHGEVLYARSTKDPSYTKHLGEADIAPGDTCPLGGQLRPHIVWFGEEVPAMEEAAAVSPAFAKDTAVQIPPRGVELMRNLPEIPHSTKTPDQAPDHSGWPPISATWFDSSPTSPRANAKPS